MSPARSASVSPVRRKAGTHSSLFKKPASEEKKKRQNKKPLEAAARFPAFTFAVKERRHYASRILHSKDDTRKMLLF